jgi:RHS repeat-associated protein
LDWFGTRYLSGAEGRFTSPDSVLLKTTWLGEPQRWNRYEYALDNPLKFVDPDGNDAIAAFFLGEEYRDVSTWNVIFSRETVTQIRSAADQFFAEHRQVTHGLSPVPTTKTEAALQAIPYVGKIAGPGLSKIAAPLLEETGGAANKGPVIIGETMKRVKEFAAKIPGATFIDDMPDYMLSGKTREQVTSSMMEYNRKWLLQQLRSGRKIIDIGLDANREVRSIFYEMEQEMIKNYRKLHPMFDNVIRSQH